MATRAEHAAVRIEIQNGSAASVPPEVKLDAWCRAALGPGAAGELTLRLVDNDEAAELNARYRGREGPTNVLSFRADPDLPHAPDEAGPLGDIVICAPLVVSEAEAQAKSAEAHWAHLVVHGVLHIMGYDHGTDETADVMENREREILAGLGFADPYAAER